MSTQETVISIAVLGTFLYFFSKSKRPTLDEPTVTQLPLEATTDVRRHLHDGSQPITQQNGNGPENSWPSVQDIL